MNIFETLFNSEKRHYAKAEKMMHKVLALEETYAAKTDEQLQEMTEILKEKLEHGKSLEDILPDAFANAREASKRVIHEFPYPVQVLGGVLLHYGDIAEMKTGEGKTLTAVMPIYLNALAGKGAHVVTVNEYLATRDSAWMCEIYRFLGLSVGCNLSSLDHAGKKEAFACDITYTTNSELGFDYLRDNMVMDLDDRVLRGLNYAILDECDSILIDEARTPLIISGMGPALAGEYIKADDFVKGLKPADVLIDEEDDCAILTESGIAKAERFYGVENFYTPEHRDLVHYTANALKANYRMNRDVEYIVSNDEIVLVDQFTGRKMEGREYSDGLHQAIQAKERVGIKQETQTLATITYQTFFRLYNKLSGMTGTAKSDEEELLNTYNMRVFVIPTNRPIKRVDEKDAVFITKNEKYDAIVKETARLYEKGQPVLIGTLSVSTSEILSKKLEQKRIPHQVLNCRNDYDEAEIIARAGHPFMVTVATNMAGRGTDIKLGEGVAQLGGLAVLGSERHESLRIDNQLRGRSGRQGDPGFSRFYASFEDDLLVEYATEESKSEMERFIQGKSSLDRIRKVIDDTQKRAEGLHFDSRKNTLEYDNTMMQQRTIIYQERDEILKMEDIRPLLKELVKTCMNEILASEESAMIPNKNKVEMLKVYGLTSNEAENCIQDPHGVKKATEILFNRYLENCSSHEQTYWKRQEKLLFLHALDYEWREHVDFMEDLKHGIGLRGYAQKKPSDEYREEGMIRFENMLKNVAERTVLGLFTAVSQDEKEEIES